MQQQQQQQQQQQTNKESKHHHWTEDIWKELNAIAANQQSIENILSSYDFIASSFLMISTKISCQSLDTLLTSIINDLISALSSKNLFNAS